jgi:hypothetical protein
MRGGLRLRQEISLRDPGQGGTEYNTGRDVSNASSHSFVKASCDVEYEMDMPTRGVMHGLSGRVLHDFEHV